MFGNVFFNELANDIKNLTIVLEKVGLFSSSLIINKYNIINVAQWRGDIEKIS